ncbi:MAG: hypothetical protein U9P70_01140 [Patescibacteria group bacterium]|nr:hypothetical protein [Patescibacteria group bacterium]
MEPRCKTRWLHSPAGLWSPDARFFKSLFTKFEITKGSTGLSPLWSQRKNEKKQKVQVRNIEPTTKLRIENFLLSFMKKIKLIIIIFLVALFPFQEAVSMQSANYKIEKDSINFGGTDDGQSASYKLKDTMGEIGTGGSDSSAYQVNAGYRQMNETYLAITSPTDVTMSPDIGGVSGGTGNGQAVWTVITDSSGGYSLDIKADSAPAMQSGANSFADYTLATLGTPDYTWLVASADSEFGFTPEGNDIVSKFKDDGVNTCNTGSNDTPNQCWSNFSTSYENIAGSFDPNHPDGTATTVKFRAESGSSHLQVEGSYQATITVTAIAL